MVIGRDVLADHTTLVRNQIQRVEPNVELSSHRDVAATTHGLHESQRELGPSETRVRREDEHCHCVENRTPRDSSKP